MSVPTPSHTTPENEECVETPMKKGTPKSAKKDWHEIIDRLTRQVEQANQTTVVLREEVAQLKAGIWSSRDKAKLSILEHFYGRVINAQVDEKARKVLDEICSEVPRAIRSGHGQT